MTERGHDEHNEQNEQNEADDQESGITGGIGPSNYAASAAEAGSAYSDRGPTIADVTGEPVSDTARGEETGNEDVTTDALPSVGDVYRGGS